jgi:hypothetical protein
MHGFLAAMGSGGQGLTTKGYGGHILFVTILILRPMLGLFFVKLVLPKKKATRDNGGQSAFPFFSLKLCNVILSEINSFFAQRNL